MTKPQDASKQHGWAGAPALLVMALLIALAISTGGGRLLASLRTTIETSVGWLYLGGTTVFLAFVLLLGFSSFGKLKLGSDDAEPAHSRATWFAMLFCAGTSVQLVYASVSEPLTQLAAPPFGRVGSQDSLLNAMNISIFHWALHPWAAFGVVALAMGYFAHRCKLPMKLSSAFHPILGERIHGTPGHIVNAIGSFITILAVVTSLAMAAPAIAAGLHQRFHVPETIWVELLVLVALGITAAFCAALGLGRGLRRCSELNLLSLGAMLLFVFFAGPTMLLIASFPDNLWAYLSYLPSNARELGIGANATEARWLQTWTIPSWAWAIAWAPSVGLFIARISKGRTIREVAIFAVLAPALLNSLWLTAFANSAFHEQELGDGMLEFAASGAATDAVFELLRAMPSPTTGILLTLLGMALFATTSTNAAASSLCSLTLSNSSDTKREFSVVLAIAAAAIGTVLVGGTTAVSAAARLTALPLCILLLIMCACLLRSLRRTRQ